MKKVLLVLATSLAACSDELGEVEAKFEAKYGLTNVHCEKPLHNLYYSDGSPLIHFVCVGDDGMNRNVFIIDGEVTL